MKSFDALLFTLYVCSLALASSSEHPAQDHLSIFTRDSTEESDESDKSVPSFSALLESLRGGSTFKHLETTEPLPSFFSQRPRTEASRAATENLVVRPKKFPGPLLATVVPDLLPPTPQETSGSRPIRPVFDKTVSSNPEIKVLRLPSRSNQVRQMDKTNFHFPPDQYNPENGSSAAYPRTATVPPPELRPVQAKPIESDFYPSRRSVGTVTSPPRPEFRLYPTVQPSDQPMYQGINSSQTTGPAPVRTQAQVDKPDSFLTLDTQNATIHQTSVGRAEWFRKSYNHNSASQTTRPNSESPVVFSERHYCGFLRPKESTSHLWSRGGFMGYRITGQQMFFLDGYALGIKLNHGRIETWRNCDLDEEALQFETFKANTEESDEHGKSVPSFSALIKSLRNGSTSGPLETSEPLQEFFAQLPQPGLTRENIETSVTRPKTFRDPLLAIREPDASPLASQVLSDLTLGIPASNSSDDLKLGNKALRPLSRPNPELQVRKTDFYSRPGQPNTGRRIIAPPLMAVIPASEPCSVQTKIIGSDLRPSSGTVGAAKPPSQSTCHPYLTFQSIGQQTHQKTTNPEALESVPIHKQLQANRSGPHPSLDTQNETTLRTVFERAQWFQSSTTYYYSSQTASPDLQSPIVFSQRHYHGVIRPKMYSSHMVAKSRFMGSKISSSRILFLDNYRIGNPISQTRDMNWDSHKLDENGLQLENFKVGKSVYVIAIISTVPTSSTSSTSGD
ncbi:hypothetical protein PSACC_02211 [Paramicrosporidium saccamoebae]|uniref:Uncharacterized protein n=1 Tax=Paramicrosporidium saccamoebae TaxID=1246581 RepID=A0A2H9TJG6_9FUNG|nr:hypothetical protein PSACC_02211 [Paramicrosporidium saccamoebae]